MALWLDYMVKQNLFRFHRTDAVVLCSEACKKFFLRSANGEYLKYRCIRDKKCPITRTTRTQCQFCRYSKCITIGMTLTGKSPDRIRIYFNQTKSFFSEDHSNPKIEDIFRGIPCAVCTDASSGLHFGVTTCEVRTYWQSHLCSFVIYLELQRFFSSDD